MTKCADCKRFGKTPANQAIWAWQPFGPAEQPSYSRIGSHYRGFPVIKLCDECKEETEKSYKIGDALFGSEAS